MAISRIKKIEILGLKEDKEALLALLQQLGMVELINLQEETAGGLSLTESQINLLGIEEAVSYLASFLKKPGFLGGVISLKPIVYLGQLKEVIRSFDYQKFLEELMLLRNHFKHLLQHKEKLIEERHLLIPWQKLKIPLDQLHYTQKCSILLGHLRTSDYVNPALRSRSKVNLLENCKKENLDLFCEAVNQDKTNTYLVILYIKEEFEQLEAILKTHYFNFVTLTRHKVTVEERLLEINREVLVLDDQLEDAKNKICQLAKQQFKLMVVYDYLANLKKQQEIDKHLARQKFTFYLSGWVKDKELGALEHSLSERFKHLAIFISQAKADEEVPVDLENNRLLQPFEFITKIYGFPKYNELDPTPFLAPFFFLYFGFCVSDVGYGFILACVSLFVLKKFKLGAQAVRFFRLFLFCGISTIIIGALTGNWFGNLFDVLAESNKIFLPLKRFKDSLIILDPLKEPTKLLGIALSFGIVQVWFGNIVAGIGNLKNKRYLDIFLDQVPMLVFLFGLTGFGLIFLKLLDSAQINLFKYAVILGGVTLFLTQGRLEKGLGTKLFYGLYNLYSALSGYLTDILSYSRLWALGLVTGVMASTINLISIQFSQILVSVVPSLSKINPLRILISSIILIVIFVAGHLVSFLMNLLGAFVHPLRLQFVEFFSKFFKTSGNGFKPFKVETKYINLSEDITYGTK